MDTNRFDFLKTDFVQGFPAFCGIKVGRVKSGFFESILIPGPDHLQSEGFVHAGVMATMADHTAGYAGYTLVPDTHRVLTIEFKINFFRPALGDRIICRSTVLNQGKKVLVADSQVYSQHENQEKMVSKATVTLMAVPDDF